MDNCWGAILKTLDETGLADNTLVFCFADHGIQFPRGMCNLTDNGLSVYLVARGPKTGPGAALTGGKVVDAMVSLMDLFPTLCQSAGITQPDWLDGKSLLPLVSDDAGKRAEKIHDELFGEVTFHACYEPMRSIRTERYKYIKRYDNRTTIVQPNVDDGHSKEQLLELGWLEQPRHQEMLYDLAFDIHECNNLIDDPKMAGVLSDLRARLKDWMVRTNDPMLAGHVTPPSGTKFNDPDGKSWHEPPLIQP
jgi:arylsulfatase A-like enzyme